MLRIVAESKKRPMLALFLCLFAAACSARQDNACQATGELSQFAVEHVYDGDTLRLRGGEKVRLIGVNTPELGRDGRAPEPLAEEAHTALQALVAGGLVWLQDGEDSRDRYGRRLAYAFNREGQSLSGALLRQGLGFQVLVAPNFRYVDCLATLEEEARQGHRGVWGTPHYQPLGVTDLKPSQGGFLRLQDEVTHVSFKENGWWIQLGGKIGLRVRGESQALFSRAELQALKGETVTVRGWLVPMDGDWWIMNVDHPAMLR